MNIITRDENPNFTIILPGPCNANCSFCTWKEDNDSVGFLTGLKYALENLPIMFRQITISGGEPTLSPYIKEVLIMIEQYRSKFNKVVLNTNATKLFTDSLQNGLQITSLLDVVDSINISRHSTDDIRNAEIFKGDVPNTAELTTIANKLKNSTFDDLIDLNYNCVLTKDTIQDPVEWIKFMKSTNIKTVTFRNLSNDISDIEQQFINSSIIPIYENNCSVYKTTVYKTDTNYTFKFQSSIFKSSMFTGLNTQSETHEVILQSNGNLTKDWEGKKILYSAEPSAAEIIMNDIIIQEYQLI